MKKYQSLTRKKIDERFTDPDLLKYKVICYRCDKLPAKCKCGDKWLRLHQFKEKLAFARLSVCLGGASGEDRTLVDKFRI